jgi:hypothetical protein
VQPVIYSVYIMATEDVAEVDCRWLYYLWRPERPKAQPTDFTMDLSHVVEEFEKIKETCRRMAWRHEQKVKARELPYNTDSCNAYGGCFYRDICGLSPQERLRSAMAQMSLKEKMAARKLQQPAVNPPANPAPAAAPAPQQVQAALPVAVQQPVPAQPAVVPGPAVQAGPVAVPGGQVLSMREKMKARKSTAPAEAPAAAHVAAAVPSSPVPAAVPAAKADVKAAVVSLSKDGCEDLSLALEMIAAGFKAVAKHFRSLA